MRTRYDHPVAIRAVGQPRFHTGEENSPCAGLRRDAALRNVGLVGLVSGLVVLSNALTIVPTHADLELVNGASAGLEVELLALTNADRGMNGLPPLAIDEQLQHLARERSEDMVARDYFGHSIPPDGELVFGLMAQRGIVYRMAGENIGWSRHSRDSAAPSIQEAFMSSGSHRANILRAEFTAVGIGVIRGESRVIFTVLFLRPVSSDEPTDRSPEDNSHHLGSTSTQLEARV
jgi:uncharacterized protein YkwD